MKRLFLLLLALTLLCASACAEEDALLPDMDNAVLLADALTDTLNDLGLSTYTAGDATSAEVACGLIRRLLYRGALTTGAAQDGAVLLDETALACLYDGLFSAGQFMLPKDDGDGMVKHVAEGLVFDVTTPAAVCAGMQIMLISNGAMPNTVTLQCELYRADADWRNLSEDVLTAADWFGTALIELERGENAPFGWRIISFGIAQDLNDGGAVG